MIRYSLILMFGLSSLLSAQTSFTAKGQVRHFAPGASAPSQIANHLVAHRADGSIVRVTDVTSPSGELGQAIEIIDLSRRQHIRVEPFTASKTTSAISPAEALLHQMAAGACKQASTNPDMQSNRLGRNVVLVIRNQPDSPVTQSNWVAPELNCTALDSTITTTDGSHADRVILNLDTAEPATQLFQLPEGLTERTAEETAQAFLQKYRSFAEPLRP